MLDELKEEGIVNKVGGRFKLSTLIQKRMVALNTGARPLVEVRGGDKLTIVIQEILQDKIYLDLSGDRRSTAGDIVKMITDPDIDYTTTPANVMTLVEFMRKTNRLKNVPASWKDMFLPIAHGLRGA